MWIECLASLLHSINYMEADIRQELVDIKDRLTEVIPKLDEVLDHESVEEIREVKIIVWSKIHEMDI